MLKTWEFGIVRIVKENEITVFDTFIREDSIGEYSFYYTPDGTVVAVSNIEE